jgi:hypothetical protein
MPGISQVKYKQPSTKSMRDQANEFASIKKKKKNKQANEFAGLGSGSKSKQKQANEFVGIKKKKPVRQANEFAGLGNKTKTKTKTDTKKTNKPKVVTPKMIKDAGFTTLRDYLNFKQGKTRKDGKKPVRVGDKKTVTNIVKPKLRPKNLVNKKTNGTKKVASLKTSRMGIDGPATTVKKKTNGKTGLGSKAMSTKTKKTFKGTNITPTAAQRKRMRSKMMGST